MRYGLPNGHADGHAHGDTDCYPDGHADGHADCYPDGDADGHADCYPDGNADGHSDGHADGHADGDPDRIPHAAQMQGGRQRRRHARLRHDYGRDVHRVR